MLAELGAEGESSSGHSHSPLPEIATKARGLVGALDEIVWAINPRHDTLASLVDYLAATTSEFLESAGITLRLDVPRELPPIPIDSERRHNLFLSVREALNNVVKHSGASEVLFRVSLDSSDWQLVVEDNGRGLDKAAANHDEGLRSLHERLTRIGGECVIQSAPDTGTRVQFTIPLAPESGYRA